MVAYCAVCSRRGYRITIFDDLSTGRKRNVNDEVIFFQGTTLSTSDLSKVFKNNYYDAVIHLAASKAAGESMLHPSHYATNNIVGSINLINFCTKYRTKSFIFSSSAAVYGTPQYTPIDESHPLKPSNYYGNTKLMIENNLMWFSKLKGMKYAALRYFNAAGYDLKEKGIRPRKKPQNLIPIVMEAAIGEEEKLISLVMIIRQKMDRYPRLCSCNGFGYCAFRCNRFLEKINLVLNLGTGWTFSFRCDK